MPCYHQCFRWKSVNYYLTGDCLKRIVLLLLCVFLLTSCKARHTAPSMHGNFTVTCAEIDFEVFYDGNVSEINIISPSTLKGLRINKQDKYSYTLNYDGITTTASSDAIAVIDSFIQALELLHEYGKYDSNTAFSAHKDNISVIAQISNRQIAAIEYKTDGLTNIFEVKEQ